jgi:hypothetical protein
VPFGNTYDKKRQMTSRFRFVFVIFFVTAVLILTVQVRSANHRIFYHLCAVNVEQGRLKQQLWQKQLQVENLINPAVISERLEYWGREKGE